ncbi:SLC34A3 [Branchiostoma lanceolatum]|uniref:SLC34A3 protein n=1 Tax=Branchiostoma lanceolatum TaxID=7740 RepID=A0A8K0A661_BRALA|nr:SLC34A3 [Branchiostoma lanceolatum]
MGPGSDKRSEKEPPAYNAAIVKNDVLIADDDEDKTKIVEEEEFDPWNVPELKDDTVPWSELTGCGKAERVVLWFLKPVLLLGLLYMFICSLDFLSSAFRLLGDRVQMVSEVTWAASDQVSPLNDAKPGQKRPSVSL